jgi:hypothetical protein
MAPISDDPRQEFLSLYPNRIQAILRPPGCKSWVSVSKHWPLPDEQIIKAIQLEAQDTVWGCRWGEFTRFAVLDIDAGSKYHTPEELYKLSISLAAIKLTASIYRSSLTGGWHVYLFFEDWQRSDEVQKVLKAWLAANRVEIRNGVLEVFPSGNGLRLPLQSGFAWLNQLGETVQERDELDSDRALSLFLNDLHERASDWQLAKSLIESQLQPINDCAGVAGELHRKTTDTDGFDGLWNYRLIPERYRDGRLYWQSGLTAKGQRHDAILAVEHYLWHGDESLGVPALPGEWNDEGRYRLVLAWLKEKHNGLCSHINRGNWQKVEADIRRSVKWRRPSDSLRVMEPYPMTERAIDTLIARSRATGRTWTQDDLKKGNDGREEKTRAKISAALNKLIQDGGRIGRNELARVSGCSPNSVSKHRDLWLLLTAGSGDQSPFLDLDHLLGVAATPSSPDNSELLPSLFQGNTRQTEELSQPDRAASMELEDLEPAAVLHFAEAAVRFCLVANSPAEAFAPIDLVCLLSCAGRQVAKARESDGMEVLGSMASPSLTEPSTGSKHWLWGSSSTCGLNGFLPSSAEPPLGPLHYPREIFYRGSGSVLLKDGGSRSSAWGPVQVAALSSRLFVISETYSDGKQTIGAVGAMSERCGLVCYTADATANGIKEVSGATSRKVVVPFFGVAQGRKKRIPDVTNYKFLTTGGLGYSSGLSDEFSLIQKCADETRSQNVIGESFTGEPCGESIQQHFALTISWSIQLWARLYGLLVRPQEPEIEACPSCRQLLDKGFRVPSGGQVRGPPKCIQLLSSQSSLSKEI